MGDDLIYRSPNGDDWLLRTDAGTGETSVVHRPNPASGGRESVMPAREFLERGGDGGAPEQRAVRAALEKAGA